MMRTLCAVAAALLGSCGISEDRSVLRVGHFPNITHAQALLGHAATRAGKGWFEERLPPGIRVEWFVFNAGPSAMEALLAGSIDLVYVGPNPALNAHVRTEGKDVRLVAGAARGGSALVVRGDPGDFRGKRIATPQFGNTQDVACRAWLMDRGLSVTQTGGDVHVLPTANPDQIALFRAGRIDAAWTVEPWVSRLETEAEGRVLVEEKDAVTTVLVASARLLKERRELARRFVAAHEELTLWIVAHPEEARAGVAAELLAETRRPLPEGLLERAWPRLAFDAATPLAAFQDFQRKAVRTGFLPRPFPLERFAEAP
jgi:NitT/TauT family transport system substrate-binding protein